jgi:hypothetical protein
MSKYTQKIVLNNSQNEIFDRIANLENIVAQLQSQFYEQKEQIENLNANKIFFKDTRFLSTKDENYLAILVGGGGCGGKYSVFSSCVASGAGGGAGATTFSLIKTQAGDIIDVAVGKSVEATDGGDSIVQVNNTLVAKAEGGKKGTDGKENGVIPGGLGGQGSFINGGDGEDGYVEIFSQPRKEKIVRGGKSFFTSYGEGGKSGYVHPNAMSETDCCGQPGNVILLNIAVLVGDN